jgi:tetratricopeptide (TPR) repeat protein
MGMAGTTWGLIAASFKEKEARDKEEETASVLDFLDNNLISSIRPLFQELGQGRNVTMRDVLLKARENLTDQFKDKPLTEARIRMTIGRSFEYLGELDIALEDQQRALDLRRTHLGLKKKETLLALLGVANVHEAMKHKQKALDARQEAYDISRELYGEQDHVTQMAMNNLANCYEQMGRLKEGVDLRERVLSLTRKHLGEKNPFTLLCMNNLAAAYTFTGKQEQSLKLLDEALVLHNKYLGPKHVNTIEVYCTRAQCLVEMKRAKEAVPLYEKAIGLRHEVLGPDHHETLSTRLDLCVCLTQLKEYAAALDHATASLPLYERKRGPDHGDTLFCLSLIIQRLHDLNRHSDTQKYLKIFFERYQGKNLQHIHVARVVAVQCEHAHAASDVSTLHERLQYWTMLTEVDAATKVLEARHWCRLAVHQQKQKQDDTSAVTVAAGCLQKAAKEGWKQFELLAETDFEPVRQHPAVLQLIKLSGNN